VKTKAEWLELLEKLAQRRPDEAEAEWKLLMAELRLGAKYFLAVHEAIQQGRWRTAENPLGYVLTVARCAGAAEKRRRERLGLSPELEQTVAGEIDDHGEQADPNETLDYLEHQQRSGEPTKSSDGVWRSAGGPEVAYDFQLTKPKRRSRMPADATALAAFARQARRLEAKMRAEGRYPTIEREPCELPDWNQWAAKAGLSEWEKKVAFYQLSHIGREEALRQQPDENSRLALQTAWKSFERTAMERLRAVAPKSEEEDDV
jgi:hypothetical protein